MRHNWDSKSICTMGFVLTCYLQNSNHQANELVCWRTHKEREKYFFTCTLVKNLSNSKHRSFILLYLASSKLPADQRSAYSQQMLDHQLWTISHQALMQNLSVFTVLAHRLVIAKQGQLCSLQAFGYYSLDLKCLSKVYVLKAWPIFFLLW